MRAPASSAAARADGSPLRAAYSSFASAVVLGVPARAACGLGGCGRGVSGSDGRREAMPAPRREAQRAPRAQALATARAAWARNADLRGKKGWPHESAAEQAQWQQ
jgi:hypothetical protein